LSGIGAILSGAAELFRYTADGEAVSSLIAVIGANVDVAEVDRRCLIVGQSILRPVYAAGSVIISRTITKIDVACVDHVERESI